MKKPTLVGTFDTSRGRAGVTTTAGEGSVTLSLANGILGATLAADQAVHAAQLLLDAARLALNVGESS